MRNHNFKLGDRVRCTDQAFRKFGEIGTVTRLFPANPYKGVLPGVGVEFDDGSGLDTGYDSFEPEIIGQVIDGWRVTGAIAC